MNYISRRKPYCKKKQKQGINIEDNIQCPSIKTNVSTISIVVGHYGHNTFTILTTSSFQRRRWLVDEIVNFHYAQLETNQHAEEAY